MPVQGDAGVLASENNHHDPYARGHTPGTGRRGQAVVQVSLCSHNARPSSVVATGLGSRSRELS